MAIRAALASRSAARALSGVRQARPTISLKSTPRMRLVKRGYASEGKHGHKEPSSDIPWALGGVAITIPSCWYLWPSPSSDHGHGHHDETHKDAEQHEGQHDQAEEASDAQETSNEKPDHEADSDKGDNVTAEKHTATEEKEDNATDESEKSSSNDAPGVVEEDHKPAKVDGVQGKGKTSAGDDENEMTQVKKIEENPKGGLKKRLDSKYRKELGPAAPGTPDDVDDPPATSKGAPSDSQGDISRKQFGLSNTATRHSTAIHEDPEMSKKSEGTPETAKAQGTVSVNRDSK